MCCTLYKIWMGKGGSNLSLFDESVKASRRLHEATVCGGAVVMSGHDSSNNDRPWEKDTSIIKNVGVQKIRLFSTPNIILITYIQLVVYTNIHTIHHVVLLLYHHLVLNNTLLTACRVL